MCVCSSCFGRAVGSIDSMDFQISPGWLAVPPVSGIEIAGPMWILAELSEKHPKIWWFQSSLFLCVYVCVCVCVCDCLCVFLFHRVWDGDQYIDLEYFCDGNRQAGTGVVEDLTMTGHVGSHELSSKMLLVYLTQNLIIRTCQVGSPMDIMIGSKFQCSSLPSSNLLQFAIENE